MKERFIVVTREVWIQPYKVEADSVEEAKAIVADAGGDPIEDSLEYSHFLDTDSWDVELDTYIPCSICGKDCFRKDAHLHQGAYIGHECCWDERLRASE